MPRVLTRRAGGAGAALRTRLAAPTTRCPGQRSTSGGTSCQYPRVGRRLGLVVAMVVVAGCGSSSGERLAGGVHLVPTSSPEPTSHVIFTAVLKVAVTGRPPCYPRPGLNVAAGDTTVGGTLTWEMLASATQAQVAAQRDCLRGDDRLGDIQERLVTGPPGGRISGPYSRAGQTPAGRLACGDGSADAVGTGVGCASYGRACT